MRSVMQLELARLMLFNWWSLYIAFVTWTSYESVLLNVHVVAQLPQYLYELYVCNRIGMFVFLIKCIAIITLSLHAYMFLFDIW